MSGAHAEGAPCCRHEGKEGGLREALDLYKRLQAMTEDIHGTKHQNNALAMRSIADIHTMLGQHGARALSSCMLRRTAHSTRLRWTNPLSCCRTQRMNQDTCCQPAAGLPTIFE